MLCRRQVLDAGFDDCFIRKRLRHRHWARVHTGVYVDHTGELSWLQRAWAAVLFYWPAALCGASALAVEAVRGLGAGRDLREDVRVAVAHDRRVSRIDGIRVTRVRDFETLVRPNRLPPRLRLEHALLDVAADQPDAAAAIAVLADACQTRRTTATRLSIGLAARARLPRRAFLLEVLEDVAEGAYSVLEHRYLTRVERPHGLPTAARQRRVRAGRASAYRDVDYLEHATVVELDGRLGHEQTSDGWHNLDRDLDSLVAGDTTVRVGWRQVEQPCRTALAVGRLLQARGWRGTVRPCGPGSPVRRDSGGSQSDTA